MARKRRTVRPRRTRRTRSAAQKAATRRMLAANRARRGGSSAPARRRRRSSARTTVVVASAPARRRSPSRKRAAAPARRRSSRRRSSGLRIGGSGSILNQGVTMLKDGAIMAVGGLGADIMMGQVNKILPDGWDAPLETDGTPNYKNAAVKAALTVAAGYVGARYAPASMRSFIVKGAAGALAVQGYNVIKASIPADFLPLGGTGRSQPSSRLAGAPLNTLRIPAQAPGNTGSLGGAPLNAVRYFTR